MAAKHRALCLELGMCSGEPPAAGHLHPPPEVLVECEVSGDRCVYRIYSTCAYSTFGARGAYEELARRGTPGEGPSQQCMLIGSGSYGRIFHNPEEKTVVKVEHSMVRNVKRAQVSEYVASALRHFAVGVHVTMLPWGKCGYGARSFPPVVSYESAASRTTITRKGRAFTIEQEDLFEMKFFNGLSLAGFIRTKMRDMETEVRIRNCKFIAEVSAQILEHVSPHLALFDFKLDQFLVEYCPKTLELMSMCISDIDMRFTRFVQGEHLPPGLWGIFQHPFAPDAARGLLILQKGIVACHLKRALRITNGALDACMNDIETLANPGDAALASLSKGTAMLLAKCVLQKDPWGFDLDGLAMLLFYLQRHQTPRAPHISYDDMVIRLRIGRTECARKRISYLRGAPEPPLALALQGSPR